MDIIKICLLALGVLIIIILLREIKKEYAVFILLASGIFFITLSVKDIVPIFDYIKELTTDTREYAKTGVILKAAALGIVTSFTSEICKDAGEPNLASKVGLCGKTAVLSLALPLLKELTSAALGILKL